MPHQALSTLSWQGANNVKYTPFPLYPEARSRNVYPSIAYSCACGTPKMNFPSAADDRLQRDIFVIGINDSFQRFCGDIISHEDLTSLTFTQVISKARDFEASIQTDSAITQQHLEEAANKVTPIRNKPKWPHP